MKAAANLSKHALHRQALLDQCEQQRVAFASDTQDLLLPLSPARLRQRLGSRLKLPLMVVGGVLGLLIVRPKRLMPGVMPVLTAAASVWKSARALLPLLRGATARVNKKYADKAEQPVGILR